MSNLRSSEVVTLIELLPYGWDDLAAAAQLDSVITDPVQIPDARSGQLIVRVHENGLSSLEGAGAVLHLDRISRARDEPETTFVDPTPMATVSLDSNDSAGSAKLAELRYPLPALTRLRMVASQAGKSVQDNTLKISAVLLLHEDSPCCAECGGQARRQGCGCP